MDAKTTDEKQPNVVLVLADDMGFSDIGCYGGEVETPNIDRLADSGFRLTQFYNTARCSPSRASLMTGLHPHQTGIGILNYDDSPEGYPGTLNGSCVTIAEVLKASGYKSYLSGKWHLASDIHSPSDSWPTRRGFDKFYGTLEGAGSYFQPRTLTRDEENIEHEAERADFYYTDAISENAVTFLREHAENHAELPFFLYAAYTAPHWPLHALEGEIKKYADRFAPGWDALRQARLERLIEMGIVAPHWTLAPRDPRVPAWDEVADPEWEALRMAVYAAQIDRMDQGIGQIVQQLEAQGALDDTLFIFLSDNGGCAEEMPAESAEAFITTYLSYDFTTRTGTPVRPGNDPAIKPGGEDSCATYGRSWANLSNTPFREYKHWIHEGGIATPLVASWPAKLGSSAAIRTQPHQLTDVMATVLEATGAEYPLSHNGQTVLPLEGVSMIPTLEEGAIDVTRILYWEHEGNSGVRRGQWKLVKKYGLDWELYDMVADRTELNDLSSAHPQLVMELSEAYEEWAQSCGVIPRDRVLDLYSKRGKGLPSE